MIIALILIGIAAGILGSATGLASLASYPGLIAVGLPPIEANVTGTFAMVFAGISSTASSQRELHGNWKEVLLVAPLVGIGCICGALLLFALPAKDFARVAPVFILCSAFLMLYRKKVDTDVSKVKRHTGAWLAIFLVGLYSGYFGAASGVLMLAILNVITQKTFQEDNAIKNLVMTFANLISMIVYAMKTTILWGDIIPLAVGYLVGGYLGPKIVRRIPQRVMQWIVAIGAVILAGWLFWRTF